RIFLCIWLQEKIERIDDGHFGHQVHFERELARLFRKDQPCQKIPVRVLLPVEKVFLGRNAQRVAHDGSAAVRRRPQAHDLGSKRYQPVVLINSLVMEGDPDAHQPTPAFMTCPDGRRAKKSAPNKSPIAFIRACSLSRCSWRPALMMRSTEVKSSSARS